MYCLSFKQSVKVVFVRSWHVEARGSFEKFLLDILARKWSSTCRIRIVLLGRAARLSRLNEVRQFVQGHLGAFSFWLLHLCLLVFNDNLRLFFVTCLMMVKVEDVVYVELFEAFCQDFLDLGQVLFLVAVLAWARLRDRLGLGTNTSGGKSVLELLRINELTEIVIFPLFFSIELFLKVRTHSLHKFVHLLVPKVLLVSGGLVIEIIKKFWLHHGFVGR